MPVNELQTHWGQRLQAARQRAGLSLSEAARRAEIDKGQLSRAEAGSVGLGDDARIRIALVYECPVNDLFPYPEIRQDGTCPSAASATERGASPTPATRAVTRSPARSAAGPEASDPEGSPADE